MEKRYYKKDGRLVWVDLTVTAVRKENKQVEYYIAVIKDIDELKKAQLELRQEERRAALYLDVAAVMILSLDRDGKIQLINSKGCEILGYSQEELIGKDWVEAILPKEVQADVKKLMQEIYNGNINLVEYFENPIITKSGEERMIAWHNGAIKDSNDQIIGILTSGQDVTDEKNTQNALRFEKEQFETIFKKSVDGIAITDLETNFLDFNDAYLKMTGLKREELLDRSCIAMSVTEDRQRAKDAVAIAIKTGHFENFEKSCELNNGQRITINMSIALLPDRKRLLITAKDITHKRAYETLLQRTIQQQEALLKIETAGFIHLKNRKIIWTNKAFESMLGYENGELIGKDIRVIYINDEEYERYGREGYAALDNSGIFSREITCVTKNGKYITLLSSLTLIEKTDNEALGVIVDITRIKEHEREIKKAQTKFFTLFNEALDAISIVDPLNHKFIEVNPAALRIYGYSKEDFLELPLTEIEILENQEEIYRRQENIIKNGWDRFITKHRTKDGKILDVIVSVRTIFLEEKPYLYCTFHDVTVEKENERQLLQLQTELEQQKNFIEEILDQQPNMVLLSDGVKAIFMNQALLEYFKCDSLQEFIERHSCICEMFIVNDLYFHAKRVAEGESWTDTLLKLPQDEHIVTMQSLQDGIIRAFNISINKFNEKYVINFTDISETMMKQRSLEDKTLHDKLTHAYNREYFEQNIHNLIADADQLAFTMIDIDHFKNINDTYGHDVGDKILKDLVRVIHHFSRKEDILIRWGGEEFLLLLKIDNKETLKKVLENLRRSIESHKFPRVNTLTCSFGAAFHDSLNTWQQTFKLADMSLYDAKASGRNKIIIK